jgi:phosphatidylglycerol:prolipoprotein diacylglycerol transferase
MANQNMLASLDLFGLILALIIGIVRIGCFLGGCCHGKPCRLGVVYPKNLVIKHEKVRKYKPTTFYNLRVFPLQLLESFICLSLFIVLLNRLLLINHLDGSTLPLFLFFIVQSDFLLNF